MAQGVIKWFDVVRGYGLIVDDDGNGAFVRAAAIPGGTSKTLQEGQRVEFEFKQGGGLPEVATIRVVSPAAILPVSGTSSEDDGYGSVAGVGDADSFLPEATPQLPALDGDAHVSPLAEGDPRTIGEYVLLGRLGEGAMGLVFLARGTGQVNVALKVARPEFARDEVFLRRFTEEAEHASQVDSVYIAKLITAVTESAPPYLVTQFIDGLTLDQHVARRGSLSSWNLKVLAVGTVAALSAIHKAGIIHRDLKPSNVMLSSFGPRVIDFGIARSLAATARITQVGSVLGTPAFMSPEQIRDSNLTFASDIFSWAGVIVYAATGHQAFGSPDTNLAILYSQIAEGRPNLNGLPADLYEVITAALNKDPAERPTTRDILAYLTRSRSVEDVNALADRFIRETIAARDAAEPYTQIYTANPVSPRPARRAEQAAIESRPLGRPLPPRVVHNYAANSDGRRDRETRITDTRSRRGFALGTRGSVAGLDARERGAVLGRLASERFDVLVIGGGVTGAGAALDAASRGLRVALVEARDLASGTSSRSSKLIDGGLRYLERLEFRLVYEALRERDLLVSKLAPHLVKPVSFMYPLYKKVVERPYVGAGLVLYDAMEGTRRPVPHHRHLTARGALKRAPALSPDRLAGAMLYYDAQVDDARHTLTVARTAAAHGALIATRASAVGLPRDAAGGRVTGARVRDEETGREFTVTAEAVVVCAGVWTDQVHELAGVRAGYRVRMSKGVHIVVPRAAVFADTGMILRTQKSVLFFIPWGQRWIVGTTDTDWYDGPSEPIATEEDIAYILDAANRVLARPLTRADVIAVYAGLRPLVAEKDLFKPTAKLSREHVVDVPVPGLASIAGGKFTTYRLMARDVVDAAVADLGREVPGSVTDQVPLLGADGLAVVRAAVGRLAEDYGVSWAVVEHLLGRYGTLTEEVLGMIRADAGLARPLADGHPYLRAEVAYAVTQEGALHVEDVLMRRTRLFIESADSGAMAAAEVATIMGRLLGWSRRRRAAETRSYLDLIEAEQPVLADRPVFVGQW